MLSSKYPYKPLPDLELPHDYRHRPLFLNVGGEEDGPVAARQEDSLFFNISGEDKTQLHTNTTPLRENKRQPRAINEKGGSATPPRRLHSRPNRSSILREKSTLLKQLKDLDHEIDREESKELEAEAPPPLEKVTRKRQSKLSSREVGESKPTKAALLLKQRNEERAKAFKEKRRKQEENEPYMRPHTSDLWKMEVKVGETNRANKLLRAYIQEREMERHLAEEKEQKARDAILHPRPKRSRLAKEDRGTHKATTPRFSETPREHEAMQVPPRKERLSASASSPVLSPMQEAEQIVKVGVLTLKENSATPKRSTTTGTRESQIIMSPEPLPSPIAYRDPFTLKACQEQRQRSASSVSGSSSADFCVERPRDRESNEWENASPCSSALLTTPREEERRLCTAATSTKYRWAERRSDMAAATMTTTTSNTAQATTNWKHASSTRLQLLSPVKGAVDNESAAEPVQLVPRVPLVLNSPVKDDTPRAVVASEHIAQTPPSARKRSASRVSFTTIDSISSQDVQETSSKCSSFAIVSEASPPVSAMKGTNTGHDGLLASPPRAQADTEGGDGTEQKRRLSALRDSVHAPRNEEQASLVSLSEMSPAQQQTPLPEVLSMSTTTTETDEEEEATPAKREAKDEQADSERPFAAPSPAEPHLSPTKRKVSPTVETQRAPPTAASVAASRANVHSDDPNVSLSIPKLSRDVAVSPPSSVNNSAISSRRNTITNRSPHGPADPMVSPSASERVQWLHHLIKEPRLSEDVPELQESCASQLTYMKPDQTNTSGNSVLVAPHPPPSAASVDCSEIKRVSPVASPDTKKARPHPAPPLKAKELLHDEPTLQNDSRSPPKKEVAVLEQRQKESAPRPPEDGTDSSSVVPAEAREAPKHAATLAPPGRYTITQRISFNDDDDASESSVEYWRRLLERTRLDITYELAREGMTTTSTADSVDKGAGIYLSTILRSEDEHASTKDTDGMRSMVPLDDDMRVPGSAPKPVRVDRMAEKSIDSDGDSVEYEQGPQEHAPTPLQVSLLSHAPAQSQQQELKHASLESSRSPDSAFVKVELALNSSSSSYSEQGIVHSATRGERDERDAATPIHLESTRKESSGPAAASKRLPPRKGLRTSPANPDPVTNGSPAKVTQANEEEEEEEVSPPPNPVSTIDPALLVSPDRPATPVPFPAGGEASPPTDPLCFMLTSQSPDSDLYNVQNSVDEGTSAEGGGKSEEADEMKAVFRGTPLAQNESSPLHFVKYVHRDM